MEKNTISEKPLITIMISENIAKGLSDPHRVKILDLLYHRNLTAKDLFLHLKKAKFNIAMTTLRHHITTLKKSGLISVYKTEEVKGTLVKYYKSNVKMLAYENFPFVTFLQENREIIDLLYPKFYKVIKKMLINEKNFMSNVSSQSKSKCKICKTYHYTEYLMFIILNMIITKVLRKILKKV